MACIWRVEFVEVETSRGFVWERERQEVYLTAMDLRLLHVELMSSRIRITESGNLSLSIRIFSQRSQFPS